jgi:hypothetical protein
MVRALFRPEAKPEAPGFSPPSFYGNDERREQNLPHSSTPVSRVYFGFPRGLVHDFTQME